MPIAAADERGLSTHGGVTRGRPVGDLLIVEHRGELRHRDAERPRLHPHRQLVAKAAGGGAAHARHAQVLAQHRGELDVEIVERGNPVDAVAARDLVHVPADRLVAGVARHRVDLVDRLARPFRADELVGGQQQDGAALRLALAQERVALEIGGDTQDGHILIALALTRL